jgi:hypothetical protein
MKVFLFCFFFSFNISPAKLVLETMQRREYRVAKNVAEELQVFPRGSVSLSLRIAMDYHTTMDRRRPAMRVAKPRQLVALVRFGMDETVTGHDDDKSAKIAS